MRAITAMIMPRFYTSKLHLKFRDRASAACILASILKNETKNYQKDNNNKNVIVLGIPNGGIITADTVARKLSVDFEIIVVKKIGDPENKEKAIGAVTNDGITYLNQDLIDSFQISKDYIAREISDQLHEIEASKSTFNNLTGTNFKIKGRMVILVDDGAATGSTIIAAARWIRKQQPKRLVISVPVAPLEAIKLFEKEADEVEVIINADSSRFRLIGQFYQNFEPVMYEQVRDIIRDRNSRIR
jgi:putative phosphoribosyl transferase